MKAVTKRNLGCLGRASPAILPGLAALVGALLPGCRDGGVSVSHPGAGATNAVPVLVATAVEENVPVRLREVARVVTINTVTVRSRVEGEITGVHFKDGQYVNASDLLFTIDPRPFEAALHVAEATLTRDKALREQALKRAQEYDEAYQWNAVAEVDRDQNRAAADASVATVHADEASLENARLNLGYCTIRSPIEGKAADRSTDLGNIVTADTTPLVLINQIKPIYVAFSVPERYLPTIHAQEASGGLKVEAAVPDDNRPPESGVLTFVDNRVDSATGTIRLMATFANDNRRLWPGQFVNATLILTVHENAVVVPLEAVQATQQGDLVYVVKPDRTVEPRTVIPGQTLKNRVVLKRGLTAGEVVVTEGQLRLVPGANVEIKNPRGVSLNTAGPHGGPTASRPSSFTRPAVSRVASREPEARSTTPAVEADPVREASTRPARQEQK